MNKLLNHGIVEVATLIPNEVKIANPKFNVDENSVPNSAIPRQRISNSQ